LRPAVVKAKTSENTVPLSQDLLSSTAKGESKSPRGVSGQSPFVCRQALRECNALQPVATPCAGQAQRPSPVAVKQPTLLSERSPASKPRQPEFRNLEGGTPAGRAAGPFMDVSVAARTRLGTVAPAASRALAPPVVASGRAAAPAPAAPPSPADSATEEAPVATREPLVVPRELAAEGFDAAPSPFFSIMNAHPMVRPEEKAFIQSCLQAFSDMVEREGGLAQYAFGEECKARDELAGKLEEGELPAAPEELLRRSCETMLLREARHGCDSLSVTLGGMYTMGMKKVVKFEFKCEDLDMDQQLSICWDWDVKLERRSLHAEL